MTPPTLPSASIPSSFRFPAIAVILFFFFFFFFFPSPTFSASSDTIYANQSLSSDQTLVSSNDVFQLGFFSPDSTRYYLGIWYNNIPDRTYVWVANRDSPVLNSSSVSLTVGPGGNLEVLSTDRLQVLWSSNLTSTANPVNPIVQLLDSGNLVVRDGSGDPSGYLWQSFDSPTDTLLPGMKFGWDLGIGLDRYLTSWSNPQDPSSGSNSFRLDFHGDPEAFLWNKRGKVYRSGAWNGIHFSGVPEMKSSGDIEFIFVVSQKEVYYSFIVNNPKLISRLIVNTSGELQRFTWVPDSQTWSLFWYAPKDQCDYYEQCGPFGICDANGSPVCNCTLGFKPKNPQAWYLRDGSNGCVRDKELDCSSDGFLLLSGMKLPESSGSFLDVEMSLQDCQDKCSRNCLCTAYSTANISGGGSGCVMWFGDLVDMRHYADGGQDLYVKLAASDVAAYGGLSSRNGSSGNSSRTLEIAGISVGSGIFVLALVAILLWKRKAFRTLSTRKSDKTGTRERSQDLLLNEVIVSSKRDITESSTDELELPLFDFNAIALATDNFSDENKLGQGGFGCVYKGALEEGQVVAVKRLSKNSGQGMEEFKNEVRLIARLQHINLVRLLGCCVEVEEKILIYEYMENKSLDSVLFSKSKSSTLTWERRFNVICGITRGLLYLHQDSRFRIIHRDLKASNILLDGELNPKISDFGMARIFGRDQLEASTRRVVGTYGYMSPEYAMDGLFSVKSDVFSFGVLVLEIVSGKKNRGFYYANNELNLLGHAWKLWKEGKGLELLDPAVSDTYSISEVLRCIQVGLLCVQEHAVDRPIMSTVVLMLGNESATMPQPKNPGFCLGRQAETDSSSGKQDDTCTVNQVTVTILDAR